MHPRRRGGPHAGVHLGTGPGLPPAGRDNDLAFTAVIRIEPDGDGTRYTATAIHGDAATRKQHDEMGFGEGWGAALDQLVELAESL